MAERLKPLLSRPPVSGYTFVGHDDPFEAATGIYPEPQGVAYVLRPSGDGFAVLVRVPLWLGPSNKGWTVPLLAAFAALCQLPRSCTTPS